MTRIVFFCALYFSLISPTYAQPEQHTVWVGQYKLQFKPSSKIRLLNSALCIEEFDYVYLRDYIARSDRECGQRISTVEADRDDVCNIIKTQIRTRCAETESLLKSQLSNVVKDLQSKQAELDAIRVAHKLEIRNHYIIGIALSVALISVTTFAIVY